MAIASSRFSGLNSDPVRAARFDERMTALCLEVERSKDLVQSQCLSAVMLVTTVIYLLARTIDSLWAMPLILPIMAIGGAGFQHAFALYGHYVRSHALPALCEGIGRLRYVVGEAPDLCFHRLVRAAILPRHGQRMIDDAFYGEYRGHRLSLAMVDLWHAPDEVPLDHAGGDAFHGVVIAIHWADPPATLPADDLTGLIEGRRNVWLGWLEGYLMLAIPCSGNPLAITSLFDPPVQFAAELQRVADVMQIPHRLIDHLLDVPAQQSVAEEPACSDAQDTVSDAAEAG